MADSDRSTARAVDTLPILELREIEAAILKPVYEEAVRRFGEAAARALIETAIRRKAIEDGRRMGRDRGDQPLAAFADSLDRWTAGGALEIDVLEQRADQLDFNVTRCRYAEMYRRMGLGDIGHLLSCNRDGAFCEGFDPSIRLQRTQTIMAGASHCDFRYRLSDDDAPDDR